MQLDITDEERDALAAFLRAGIDADKFPRSPRLAPIRAVLAKLTPRVEAEPAPSPPGPYAGPTKGARARARR